MEKSISELIRFSIINLDKPTGPTSFSVSEFVKKSLKISKTSHFGTLDPQVTGVLPIALGRACRLSEYFMHRDKTYVGIMRLHEEISEEKLKSEMSKFLGKIIQLPPIRSRVKRAHREREVKFFDLLEKNGRDVLFITQVEAGTYIRKLIHDLGEKIGGAHMLELRRTKAGIFSETDKTFVNLYDFESALQELNKGNEEPLRKILIPAEDAIKNILPAREIESSKINGLLTGRPLHKVDLDYTPKEERFAIFNKEKFIGIYRSVSEEGDIIARPEFVFN